MRLPKDMIIHIDTELAGDEVRVIAEPQGELVRCKDCRYAYFKDFDGYCPHMVNMLKPDGFCYRGERRKDANTD